MSPRQPSPRPSVAISSRGGYSIAPAAQAAPRSYGRIGVGRRRTKDFDLPPRMQRKGTSYWHVSSGKRRIWTKLGTDLARAKRRWAELEDCTPRGLTVADLVQHYIDLETRPHGTLLQYRSYHKTIAEAFPIPAAQLRSAHVAVWRDMQGERRVYANGVIALLAAACRHGQEQDLSQIITVRKWKEEVRDRDLLPAEFLTIRERAPEWLQVAMDLCYLTSARRSDILGLKWSQVSDEGIRWRLQKTDKRQFVRMSADLSSVLQKARQRPILGLYVIANERGRQIRRDMLHRAWTKAATGIEDAQFRDIRAMAAKAAKEGGQDYQALLGHADRAMSERYIKGRETVIAEPVRRKL